MNSGIVIANSGIARANSGIVIVNSGIAIENVYWMSMIILQMALHTSHLFSYRSLLKLEQIRNG